MKKRDRSTRYVLLAILAVFGITAAAIGSAELGEVNATESLLNK